MSNIKKYPFHCYDIEDSTEELLLVVTFHDEDDEEITYEDDFVVKKEDYPDLKSRNLGYCTLNKELTEIKKIEIDEEWTKQYMKNMKKLYNEMIREKPYIKFYVVGEQECKVSGKYKIFMVEGAYNEFYCDKENMIGGMDDLFTSDKNEEVDKVEHIQLFYEFSFKDKDYKFESLEVGMEGEYSKTNGVIKYKNLKMNKDKCNEILENIESYLSSYHYSYSVESIGLKLDKIN